MKPFSTLAAAAAAVVLCSPAVLAQDTAYCSLPGELMSEDAAGDATFAGAVPDPVPGHDVLSLHVAELPSADGIDRIYFTMKVDRLAEASTPQSRYLINFQTSDGITRFLRYTPYPLGPVSMVFTGADQMYSYGHFEVNATTGQSTSVTDGPADAASSASADGTITIVLAKDKLPESAPGELLVNVVADSRIYNISGTIVVDKTDAAGVYELRGNASCAGGGKSGSGLVAGGLPAGALLLLALAGLARRRN